MPGKDDIKKIDEIRDELRIVEEQICMLEDRTLLVDNVKILLEIHDEIMATQRKRGDLLSKLMELCRKVKVCFEYP